MIHYDFDTTENGYSNIKGCVETIDELKRIVFKDAVFSDCVGHIKTDSADDSILWFSAIKELGVYLGISNRSGEYLSLCNRELLSEVVDVWGDGLYISKGLFIPTQLAWIGIQDFVVSGVLNNKIQWISSKDIPENGNYIL